MNTLIKRLSGMLSNGMWWSAHPDLQPLILERDYPDIERLLRQEEWPFTRADFELSHAQPDAVSYTARMGGEFAGFFTTHCFGAVAYLDMMIIDRRFRGSAVARPLYFTTLRKCRRRSYVVHTTNDSARLIRLLGFKPGASFTLLRREPVGGRSRPSRLVPLGPADEAEVVALDAATFGIERPRWFGTLLRQAGVECFGLRTDGRLTSAIALRPRAEGGLSLDCCVGDVPAMLHAVLESHSDRRLECFARTASSVHRHLLDAGFHVPDFFHPIGPLIEWHRGPSHPLGHQAETLLWL